MAKKIVITGGPCCGKTSIINELKNRGFQIVTESAREVIDEKSAELLPKERLAFELEIFNRQKKKEEILNSGKEKYYFLDRSLIDNAIYCKFLLGYVPEEVLNAFKANDYDFVFCPDLLPFENDGKRIESSQDEANKIHNDLIGFYESLGYKVFRIPVMPIQERVDLIIKKVKVG